jgi:hypothetical protein
MNDEKAQWYEEKERIATLAGELAAATERAEAAERERDAAVAAREAAEAGAAAMKDTVGRLITHFPDGHWLCKGCGGAMEHYPVGVAQRECPVKTILDGQAGAAMLARMKALENALGAFEWGGKCFDLERDLCPVCGHIRTDGHDSECWLAAALQGRDKLREITDALQAMGAAWCCNETTK